MRGTIRLAILAVLAGLLAGCGQTSTVFSVTSPALSDGGAVAARFTCDGTGLSPPLQWSNLPPGTVSLALIVEDPDAPGGVYTHWVLYNLPPNPATLAESQQMQTPTFAGGLQGQNSGGRLGYDSICPPPGSQPHHYYFKLYALDATLPLAAGATRDRLLGAMQVHIRGQGQLMAIYVRP